MHTTTATERERERPAPAPFSVGRAHFLDLPRRVIILSFSYCIYINPFLLLFLPIHQQFKFNQRFKIIQPFRPKHFINSSSNAAKVERVADTYDFHVDLSIFGMNGRVLVLEMLAPLYP